MILAPIDPLREAELRRALESMNTAPGRVHPHNRLIPFDTFDKLHFARLLIIDDRTVEDIRVFGLQPRKYPLYLAFLGDVDGDPDPFLRALARRVPEGLRTLISCCDGFPPDGELYPWMKAHSVSPAASYVNWRGRTVRRVREEHALHETLDRYVTQHASDLAELPPREVRMALQKFVDAEKAAGRLTLSPDAPTPLRWRLANLLHLVGWPLLLLLLSPLLLVAVVVGAIRLRAHEKSDVNVCPRVDTAYSNALAALEDHDVTNQFSALGSVKPGVTRRLTVASVLGIIDYFARHLYTRGRLARVRTIHFARWVWLDNKERVVFLSNYDGSLESYMDDFINKAGFGLNASFGSGVGYPRTNWLVLDGCHDERNFKEYLRRHQIPTQVWYRGYPSLTAVDLERNGRIREGLEAAVMGEREARAWVGLI